MATYMTIRLKTQTPDTSTDMDNWYDGYPGIKIIDVMSFLLSTVPWLFDLRTGIQTRQLIWQISWHQNSCSHKGTHQHILWFLPSTDPYNKQSLSFFTFSFTILSSCVFWTASDQPGGANTSTARGVEWCWQLTKPSPSRRGERNVVVNGLVTSQCPIVPAWRSYRIKRVSYWSVPKNIKT